jgi:hypothetical protein
MSLLAPDFMAHTWGLQDATLSEAQQGALSRLIQLDESSIVGISHRACKREIVRALSDLQNASREDCIAACNQQRRAQRVTNVTAWFDVLAEVDQ